MRFTPPCCPNPECAVHEPRPDEASPFYVCLGFFKRHCDGHSIQRYQCKRCGLGFSSQTFRANYRQKRPDINAAVFEQFSSKVTQRQCARILGVDKKTIGERLRKFGPICKALHEHFIKGCDALKSVQGGFVLDEGETYATSRRNDPLTFPVLIHHDSFFVVHTSVGSLPRRGGKGRDEQEPLPLDADERRERARGSREAVQECVEALAKLAPSEADVTVKSDQKRSYADLLGAQFGGRLQHAATSSRAPRSSKNPLFRINLTLAMMRDAISRLVRRTWAASKHAVRLRDHLWVWTAYRNYVRGKTNADWDTTPAMAIGACAHKLTPAEVLRWGARYVALLQPKRAQV